MRKSPTACNLPARASLVSTLGYGTVVCNSQHYRWGALASVTISGTTYQAICFWNSSGKLVVGKRVLDGAWTLYTYDGSGGLANIAITAGDNHNVASLGIDPDGYIHVCYDMHAVALKYAKSNAAINAWTGALTTGLSMVGTNETSVTYPTFINDPAGNLYFLFRDGSAGNGDLYFYKYTHGTTTWAAAAGTGAGGKLIDGKGETPDRSPYWVCPCFDADFGSGGFLHFSFHWRVTGDSSGANRDLCYMKWDGTNWKKADGSAQTVPLTSANCEVVDSTGGENLGLTGGWSMYSDASGNPHIAYPKTHTDTYRHIFHAYHNGVSWAVLQLTSTNDPSPSLGDNSAFDFGFTPLLVVDRASDVVYVFYRDLFKSTGLLLLRSDNFTDWSEKVIYPYDIGWCNVKFDPVEFERSGNLYLSIEEYKGALLAGNQTAFPLYVWKVPGDLL